MVMIGEKTKQIVARYQNGATVEEIAKEFGITISGVNKRLRSFTRLESGFYTPANPNFRKGYVAPVEWTLEQVKKGFEQFITEHGKLPTAYEVDDTTYLPSARQIQRRFGGLSKLREDLGYADIHFGKGTHRRDISKTTGSRGRIAEDELEKLLVDQFGELYVQSEKRFGGSRNRIDFMVYAQNALVGIDVFATDEKRTIIKNVAVKIPKYTSFPSNIPLYFVVWSEVISDIEIESAVANISAMTMMPNLKVVGVSTLMERLHALTPLESPQDYLPFPHPEPYNIQSESIADY